MSESVGSIIKKYRTENNLTQENVAYGICSVQHLYRIEKGKRLPSGYLVYQFKNVFGDHFINELFSDKCKW